MNLSAKARKYVTVEDDKITISPPGVALLMKDREIAAAVGRRRAETGCTVVEAISHLAALGAQEIVTATRPKDGQHR